MDKQIELFSLGEPYKRDAIIRMNVLSKFAELVLPEAGFSKSEFTWDNEVIFLPKGSISFTERLADIDKLISQAGADKRVTYDYSHESFSIPTLVIILPNT